MLFAQLVASVLDEADVRAALADLVARKQAGEELAVTPPVALSRFIEAGLPRLDALNDPDDAAGEVEKLTASSAATDAQLERRKQPRRCLQSGSADGVTSVC